MIRLNGSRCVRSLAKESICTNCETICPKSAIFIGEGNVLPAINFSLCVECGACDALCPNEAFSFDTYKPNEFFFEYLEDEDNTISCRKNVPCIAAINIENLISLALMKKEVVFDMGYCDECDIAHKCKPQILKLHEEALYLLEAFESSATIKLEDLKYKKDEPKQQSSRREFFAKANLTDVALAKHKFEEEVQKATDELVEHSLSKTDIALLRKKRITDRRKLLFSVLKRVGKPSFFHVLEANELSFTSMKLMDRDSCTACQMCYRVCPTGALTSDIKNSKIDFDPLLCIKCHTCHDVCEPNSLTLSPSYRVTEFFEPNVYNLIKFNVRRCDECNMFFSSNTDDKLCYRCKAEEEEARELWGLSKDF